MTTGIDIVNEAKKYLGLKYVWGGNSLQTGVDCSGLVQQVFKLFGINTTRTTYTQIGEGSAVSFEGLRPGDLVFFDTNPSTGGPDHVGIYAGDGKMIHAPNPHQPVKIDDITKGTYAAQFMGGRRLGGYTAVGGSSADLEPEAKVKMTPEELAASYGWAYGFLNSNPELKKLFDSAVKETWAAAKFQAELRDTKWWKETSETRRQAQVMKKTDPASWRAAIEAQKIKLTQLAAEMGAAIPPSKLAKIAADSIETGMDEDLLRNALGQYVGFTKNGTLVGEAGMHAFAIKKYAASQGVELSDDAIKSQAQMIVRKVATTQDFESQIREQAKSLLPGYEEQIDAGMTVKDIAAPYIQTMSQELELPEDAVTINDPIIRSALNGLNADGKPGGVNLVDFQSQLRNDPRWRNTSNARDGAMAVGLKVLRDMGLSA